MTEMQTTKLTNQEAFDKALQGIRNQGYQISTKNETCAYRGECGLKCAIGHLIPDNLYVPSMDSAGTTNIGSVVLNYPEIRELFSHTNISLLTKIQFSHDTLCDIEGFEDEMKEIAREFNLAYSEPISKEQYES